MASDAGESIGSAGVGVGVGEVVRIYVRGASLPKFHVHANLDSTVLSFKTIVEQKCQVPAPQQRLIHKGRLMKDDQTLRNSGLEGDRSTVFLVRGFVPADGASTSTSTSDAAGSNVGLGAVLESVRNILNIPAVRDSLNNPEAIHDIITDDTQVHDFMDHNPELAQILNNPATLRQIIDAAHNPEISREISDYFDASPEGLDSLIQSLEAMGLTEDDSSQLESDNFASLFGPQAARTGSENFASFITPAPQSTTNSPAGRAERRYRNLGAQDNPEFGNTTPFARFFPELRTDSTPDSTIADDSDELMQDPEISQTMELMLSNPKYLTQMLGFNEELREMLDFHPWIRDVMQNPVFIARLARPPIVRQLLIYHRGLVLHAALEEGLTEEEKGMDTASWELEKLMNLLGLIATRSGIASAPHEPQGTPEEEYAAQLSELQEMGFMDTQRNIRALIATAGNVRAAVDRLLRN